MEPVETKRPSPDFVIRLTGNGIKPWLVPTRTLSRVLGAVLCLVHQKDDLADDEDDESEAIEGSAAPGRTLKLLTITSHSAAYAVSAQYTDTTLSLLRDTGTAIQSGPAQWHPATVSSLAELSQIAKTLNCVIELRSADDRGRGDVLAVIGPSTSKDVQQRAFVFGQTSVYGRLERVAEPRRRVAGFISMNVRECFSVG